MFDPKCANIDNSKVLEHKGVLHTPFPTGQSSGPIMHMTTTMKVKLPNPGHIKVAYSDLPITQGIYCPANHDEVIKRAEFDTCQKHDNLPAFNGQLYDGRVDKKKNLILRIKGYPMISGDTWQTRAMTTRWTQRAIWPPMAIPPMSHALLVRPTC